MSFRVLAVAALAAAAAFPATATATAPPAGNPCGFLSVNQADVTGPTTWTGHIRGGPVAAPGAASVMLTCSIHVGNTTHAGPAVVTESATGRGVAVLEPRLISYEAEEWDVVAICTAVTVDGVTWYRTGAAWAVDPATPCLLADVGDPPVPDLPPRLDPVEYLLRCLLDEVLLECGPGVWPTPDGEICPALVEAYPLLAGIVDIREDGDVYVAGELLWDCPPYEPWT